MGKTEQEEEEEEGTEGQFPINVLLTNQWRKQEIMKYLVLKQINHKKFWLLSVLYNI